VKSTASKSAPYYGFGAFAAISGEAHDLTMEDCEFNGNGSFFITYDPGNVTDPVTGIKRPAGPMENLTVTGSKFTAGSYGIKLAGNINGGQPTPPVVNNLIVTGNTVSGAQTALKTKFPDNTYIATPTW
jgi:hypothetical protein